MAEWFWQKLDVFVAAVFVAAVGIAVCESHLFMAQYIQRQGIEVDAARAHLTDVQSGLRYRVMADTVRAELEQDARGRYTLLKRNQDSIVGANALLRPLAMIKYRDSDLQAQTRSGFVPGLPKTVGDFAYALLGMLIGFLAYEVAKLPVLLMARDSRRRRFRRRG